MDAMLEYDWPGNVRELERRLQRAIAFAKGGVVSDVVPAKEKSTGLRNERKEFEKKKVADALKSTGGNRTEAAKLLGISRRMLQKKLKEFGINK